MWVPSSVIPRFHLIEQFANLVDFFGGRFLHRQRLQDQISRRTAKRPIEQRPQQSLLRLLLRSSGTVDLRTQRLVTHQQTLVGHDLHELENGRMADRLPLAEILEHLSNGGGFFVPDHIEDVALGLGGS